MENKSTLSSEYLEQFFALIKKEEDFNYNHPGTDKFEIEALQQQLATKSDWRNLEIKIGQLVTPEKVYKDMKQVWINEENKRFSTKFNSEAFKSLSLVEKEKNLLLEFNSVNSGLSPENIYQDGEASSSHIQKTLITLQQRWKNIENKLGYTLECNDFSKGDFFKNSENEETQLPKPSQFKLKR